MGCAFGRVLPDACGEIVLGVIIAAELDEESSTSLGWVSADRTADAASCISDVVALGIGGGGVAENDESCGVDDAVDGCNGNDGGGPTAAICCARG